MKNIAYILIFSSFLAHASEIDPLIKAAVAVTGGSCAAWTVAAVSERFKLTRPGHIATSVALGGIAGFAAKLAQKDSDFARTTSLFMGFGCAYFYYKCRPLQRLNTARTNYENLMESQESRCVENSTCSNDGNLVANQDLVDNLSILGHKKKYTLIAADEILLKFESNCESLKNEFERLDDYFPNIPKTCFTYADSLRHKLDRVGHVLGILKKNHAYLEQICLKDTTEANYRNAESNREIAHAEREKARAHREIADAANLNSTIKWARFLGFGR